MKGIELLLQRQSNPLLTSPMPTSEDVDKILAAAMRVPDHACLQPWHFTVVFNDGLQRLSDLFVASSDMAKANLDKISKMPFRAPMIIVISTKFVPHEKVPKQEQLIAAGCCAHAMQMAAFALGYGAMWRTGDLAYNPAVKQGLNIEVQDEIVGFLYLGTESRTLPLKPAKQVESKVSFWQ